MNALDQLGVQVGDIPLNVAEAVLEVFNSDYARVEEQLIEEFRCHLALMIARSRSGIQ